MINICNYFERQRFLGAICAFLALLVHAGLNQLAAQSIGRFDAITICDKATTLDGNWSTDPDLNDFVDEAKGRQIRCENVKASLNTVGICQDAVIDSNVIPCAGVVVETETHNGRLEWAFRLGDHDSVMLRYSGDSDKQKSPDANTRIQPIDSLLIHMESDSKSHVRYSGEGYCLFENPYRGVSAKIECEFENSKGLKYANYFESDGNEPFYRQ